jgi:serine/threonine protein kinase
MAVLSFPDFVAALQQFPLLHPESRGQLTPLQEQFPDSLKLGEELIRRGMLTPLQADRIVRGRQSELFLGRYTLIDRLGEGGAGQVYKAWDTENSRFVALKVLRGELVADPDTVSRFHREISVSSQLPPHPHVIGTLDAGRVGDTHFLAMEYVQGTDLDHLVKNTGPLPVDRACDLLRQTALGLQHAHEHGLVHRDIKPSNLMMVSGPGEGTVKILDLGLARLHADFGCGRENTFKTSDGSVTLGTVDYQAPEQALDFHATDIRADIYSLGCTAYYLLTGSAPFGAGPLAVKLMRHQQTEPPDLRELRPDVPPGLIPIVSRMLAKNPADRYATPGEVAAALTELTQPRPEPKPQQPQKQSPPRKSVSRLLIGAVGAIAVSVLLLVAVLPSTGRSRTSPDREKDETPTAATPATPRPKPPPAPDSVEATVPEAADYQLVYDLNLENLSKHIVYDVDRRNRITRRFDRVAYFIELQKPEENRQYLYVSMAAFTRDLGEIGVPTFDSGARFQTNVASMNVYSNVAGIVTGTNISTGNIEFWPNNYGPGNAANVPGADSKQFDFGDQMSPQPADGHGCMQVHNYGAKQTLFALNNWRSGGKAELGIGNNPNPKGNPDWTFAGNAASYKSKRLRVLVRCK